MQEGSQRNMTLKENPHNHLSDDCEDSMELMAQHKRWALESEISRCLQYLRTVTTYSGNRRSTDTSAVSELLPITSSSYSQPKKFQQNPAQWKQTSPSLVSDVQKKQHKSPLQWTRPSVTTFIYMCLGTRPAYEITPVTMPLLHSLWDVAVLVLI